MARRRFRSNVWFDHAAGHRKAARKGWRKRGRGRRRRDNPGALSIRRPLEAIKSGFKLDLLKRGAFIVGGNLLTTLVADKLINSVGILKSYKAANIATVLATAGVAGALTHRFLPTRSNDVLLGGMLAGITRTLKMIWPAQFGQLGDDLEGDEDGLYGLEDYYNPGEPIVQGTSGLGDYMNAPNVVNRISMAGIGDSAVNWQTMPQNVKTLDGLADQAVAEEMAMQA